MTARSGRSDTASTWAAQLVDFIQVSTVVFDLPQDLGTELWPLETNYRWITSVNHSLMIDRSLRSSTVPSYIPSRCGLWYIPLSALRDQTNKPTESILHNLNTSCCLLLTRLPWILIQFKLSLLSRTNNRWNLHYFKFESFCIFQYAAFQL